MKYPAYVICVAAAALSALTSASLAANDSEMMAKCNTYAAHHLHLPASDIAEVKYEGQRTDGTHAVNGSATNGQTFQCSFNKAGTHVVGWTHSAPTGCPPDVSEADRYRYPACN